jgi:itaconate CoA-transferase
MYTFSGILTALLQRERTGCGTNVEVSLFEALGEWMGYAMYYTLGGSAPARTGASHAAIAPYGPYKTADGRVILGVHSEREWASFCRGVLRRPSLVDDPRFQSHHLRIKHRSAMDAEIEEVLTALPTTEVIERLESAQIANARMNTVQEFIAHPQLDGRAGWRKIESPVGPIPALVPPARMGGVEPVMGPIPALGEHSESILGELGFSASTIEAWRREAVI